MSKKLSRVKRQVRARAAQVDPATWDLEHQSPRDQGRLSGQHDAYCHVLQMIEEQEARGSGMKRKRSVMADTLVLAGQRPDGKLFARFRNTHGLAAAEGRETLVVLSKPELAVLLGMLSLDDLSKDDGIALIKVIRALRKKAA